MEQLQTNLLDPEATEEWCKPANVPDGWRSREEREAADGPMSDTILSRKRGWRQEEEHLTAEKLVLSRFQRREGDRPRSRQPSSQADDDIPCRSGRDLDDQDLSVGLEERDTTPWLSTAPAQVKDASSVDESPISVHVEESPIHIDISTPPEQASIATDMDKAEQMCKDVRSLIRGMSSKGLKPPAAVIPSPLRRRPLKVLSISNGSCQRVEFGTSELLRLVHTHRPQFMDNVRSGLLRLRDLRQILSSGPGSQRPSIEPRRSCILVNMPNIKALIMRNRVFLIARPPAESIVRPTAEAEKKLPFTTRKSRVDLRNMIPNLPGDTNQCAKEVYTDDIAGPVIVQKLMKLSELQAVPFEFLALEAILFEVISKMADALEPMQALADNMQDAKSHTLSSTTALHEIRDAKRFLQEIEGHAKGIARSLEEILENEEDVRRLEISRFWDRPDEWDAPEDSPGAEDVEILLESYQQDVESMLLNIEAMDETLDTILQLMQLHLATTRNILLKFEIGLQVIGVAVALVAAVAGLFGMNVPNGFEQDRNAFWEVSYLMTIMITITGVAVGLAIFRLKL